MAKKLVSKSKSSDLTTAAPAKPAATVKTITAKQEAVVPAKPVVQPAQKPAKTPVSAEMRLRMIQEAAYYEAEKNGFKGDPQQFWKKAEAIVAAHLTRG